MNNKVNFLAVLKKWKHVSGYSGRNIINSKLSVATRSPKVIEYSLEVDKKYGIHGKSILFFADLHFEDNAENNFFPEVIQHAKPDWIVFGGDLATYACFIEGAFEWLNRNFADFADIPKIAVPGNWDRRRKRWFFHKIWYDKYIKSGFTLLLNESITFGNIRFYGLDEPRLGSPILKNDSFDPDYFNCVVSHCIEPIVDNTTEDGITGDSLALCGHSHAGQIRIPFIGAIFTSTKYWKLFEYGLYKHKYSNLNMIMTSGMGTSRIPFRLFCQPEVVIIKFKDK